MRRATVACAFALACLAGPTGRVASAQAPPQTSTPPAAPAGQTAPAPAAPQGPGTSLLQSLANSKSWQWEQVTADHLKLTGEVKLDLGPGVTIFANNIDIYTDTNRLEASGNVVFTNPEGRIAAESVEFNLADNTGTFHTAWGLMSLGAKADRLQFANQEPDVYFYGQTIEKQGPQRYRITRGGFTTCVQPTPRWELTSGSVLLNLNDYALASNTVLRVKGVPMMYLPVVYYPIQDDNRATGFLLPTYGASTFRGQAISNAFFWAINRSQDATFFHDWFTRAGQGEGAEYRYVASPSSFGNFRVYRFGREETSTTINGTTQILPATNAYSVIGSSVQTFGPRIRARTRVDYFSDITTQQLLQQNPYQSTQRNRLVEGSVTAGFGPVSTTTVYQRNELVNGVDNTVLYGSTPRFSASLAPQRLFNSPIYASINSEAAFLPYHQVDGDRVIDRGFARYDLSPSLRVPLSKLTFLSVNASGGYRTTYYSRTFDNQNDRNILDEPMLRRYATFRTDVVGPVFTRIWEMKDSSFAERLKHVIEPAFTVDTTSAISNYTQTPNNTDASDYIVGNAARFTYGITNRFLYRGRAVNGVRGQTREFVTIGLQQTYYSNPDASRADTSYQATLNGSSTTDLSPIALTARVSPSSRFDANARLEYNVSGVGVQVFSLGSSINGERTSGNVNFSRRKSSSSSAADDFITGSFRTQLLDRRTTATYSLSWDIGRGYIQNQSLMASYMAQCCGLQVEFQKYNFVGSNLPVPSDLRFNFGFVLAGLGTFSNFFGSFGGQR